MAGPVLDISLVSLRQAGRPCQPGAIRTLTGLSAGANAVAGKVMVPGANGALLRTISITH